VTGGAPERTYHPRMEGASDPYVSPDGVWRWNGAGWVPNVAPRPVLPGPLQAARILLYIQGGLIILAAAAGSLVVAGLGSWAATEGGGSVSRVLIASGLLFAGGVLLGVAMIVAGVKLARRVWAYRLAIGLQVVAVAAGAGALLGQSRSGAASLVGLAVPAAGLWLLLLPESRAAIRTAGR